MKVKNTFLRMSSFHFSGIKYWFYITTLDDWLKSKHSHHFFIQSEVKPKPIEIGSLRFSRASRQLQVFPSCFDWFTGLFVSCVIGLFAF